MEVALLVLLVALAEVAAVAELAQVRENSIWIFLCKSGLRANQQGRSATLQRLPGAAENGELMPLGMHLHEAHVIETQRI